MNQKAARILTQQADKLLLAANGVRLLLDNPDDMQLDHQTELELRNAVGLIEAIRVELRKLCDKSR